MVHFLLALSFVQLQLNFLLIHARATVFIRQRKQCPTVPILTGALLYVILQRNIVQVDELNGHFVVYA